MRLLGGLHLTPEAAARLTGNPYDQEQINEIRLTEMMENDQDWLRKLYSDEARLARYKAEDKE